MVQLILDLELLFGVHLDDEVGLATAYSFRSSTARSIQPVH